MLIKEIEYGLSGIYKITFDNNKVYVGLSNDIRRRMIEHFGRDLKQHPNLLLSKAIVKHKVKDIEILEFIDEADREKLKEREIYWINYYNSYLDRSKGYNMTPGGDGASSGIYNNSSNLSQEDLDNIYNLLLNSNLSYEEIADKTNASYSIVSRINNGAHYFNKELDYPLRKQRNEKYELNNKHSAFYEQEEKLLSLIQDLKENLLSYQELENKYNIKTTTLSMINQGKKYRQENEIYPLRPVDKGRANRKDFSLSDLEQIKELLVNSNLSMIKIGEKFNCSRDLISDINQGKKQNQPNWNYPLRKHRLKTGPKSL